MVAPYYADDWLTVYQGDCRTVLAELPAESVHCVVTSPPYWGLRDYGTATWDGGDPDCDHRSPTMRDGLRPIRRHDPAVFREVRRVLRSDGTVWLNLGDSYASHDPGGYREGEFLNPGGRPPVKGQARNRAGNYRPVGLKAKDLVGIPWRVAFALQADGWYLRSDIIWAKPNPMPESVTDRPTKAHEYLFLLSKSPRYFYDAAAVAEPLTDSSIERLSQPSIGQQEGSWRVPGKTNGAMKAVGGPSWQERKAAGATAGNVGVSDTYQNGVHGEGLSHDLGSGPTRNLRSVWTVSTQPYPGAHFATFPRKLVEPCIKAGCPTDGVVLDPFAGSGTTGMVAQALGRKAVLIDLNPDYLVQAMGRNRDIPLGLVG